MTPYPPHVKKLIGLFAKLPGIGPKTAERLVLFLLERYIDEFKQAFNDIAQSITYCERCYTISQNTTCVICNDIKRNNTIIAVVAKPQDIAALERSNIFTGVYFVLGGLLNPLEGIAPEKLRINALETRINNHHMREVILAFDSTIEGEATAQYIAKKIKQHSKVIITRLARGLPVGSDLEYADEVTLGDAIMHRRLM